MKLKSLLLFLVGILVFSTTAFSKGTVKIAFIDPLSGAMGEVGDAELKHFIFVADKIAAEGGFLGGTNFEIVPFDNKMNAKESLVQLKHAIDQGIHFVVQGNGSSVGGALIEAVKKHNKRNPDKRVVYFNYGAITPSFTESECDFWHFRFDSHVDMKVAAFANTIKKEPKIKKVFLLNQDYSFGHAVSKAAKLMLKAKRPDIKIVGDTFHPISKVKDFSPYVAKIKKSGAQAIITGNWGTDMTLLAKAADQAGLDVSFYTFYAGGLGTPTAAGDAFEGLLQVSEWHANLPVEYKQPADEKYFKEYNQKYSDGGKSPFYYGRIRTMLEMLVKAFNKAGSTDPKAVAYALEGMEVDTFYGKAIMRGQDHQLLAPLFVSRFKKVGSKNVKYDVDKTPYGPSTELKIDAMDTATPSSCKMARP